ncbi:MAG: signal peptidase II [Bacillota bacterium]|nr:signal peptidase II [Bacillota bacterium]
MFWIVMIAIVAVDQLSKYIIVRSMELGQSIEVIDGFFHLTYVLNTGASFSLLQDQRWFFIVLTVIVLAVVFIYLRQIPRDKKLLRLLLAGFCGGAIGNFIDRLYQGAVVDFLDFKVWPPVFNVADSFLVVSVIALCIYILFEEKSVAKGREQKHE